MTLTTQMPRATRQAWLPIRQFDERFAANVKTLSMRHPNLAISLQSLRPKNSYCVLPDNGWLRLGINSADGPRPQDVTLSPATAREITNKCYPASICDRPIVVAGEDLGWLWHGLYELPCKLPEAVEHRPPLYFLIRHLERLWLMLHIKDWQQLLADPRVRLFAGDDAIYQLETSLLENIACPWPRLAVGFDATLWPANMTINSLSQKLLPKMVQRMTAAQTRHKEHARQFTTEFISQKFAEGGPLRVLGITSRYTTFLQHSMRDWLEAFDRLGHHTELLIESADHELPCTLLIAEACAKFKPDLIVMIDHYRAEMPGLPEGIPTVMWIQDCLAGIYTPAAGAAQASTDYVMGFAYEKLRLVHEMGYPADQFLPTTIGVNPRRFFPTSAHDPRLEKYACDVSLVTHASVPAEQLMQVEIEKNSLPAVKQLLRAVFEKLRAVYETGGAIVAPAAMRRIIDDSLLHCGIKPNSKAIDQLMNLFYGSINNALFRHQTLDWLIDLGIEPHLYGRGWEKNPKFSRFARGEANNQTELPLIYQASKINLHISPNGCLHQRVLEGLASGGFFLLRRCDGDIIGRHYAMLHDYCSRVGIMTDQQLQDCEDPQVQAVLRQVIDIHHCDPFAEKYSFKQLLQTMHDSDYLCSAGCVWGQDFDRVSFASKQELAVRLNRFSKNTGERESLTRSMLEPVRNRFTYEATCQRLLKMISIHQLRCAQR